MNNRSKILQVIGAGGHAKVVIQTARAAGFEPIAVFDDDISHQGTMLCGVPVKGKIADIHKNGGKSVIAIGNNVLRKKLAESLGCDWATIIHPTAVIDQTVQIGPGTVIFAGSVIQVDSRIGNHVIVNTSASIDHDCTIDNYSHIAPGCRLCGKVHVGEGTLLGVGTCVTPLLSIGSWSVIGAGATVVAEISDQVVAVGSPAKIIRKINDEQNQ